MRYKKGLDKDQKKALKQILAHTDENFIEKVDICLVASGHKHHGYEYFHDKKLLEKVYLPAFDKIGLKFMPAEGIREFRSKELGLVYTKYSIYKAIKQFKKERSRRRSIDWGYVHKYFPDKEEWIPYLIHAIRNNPSKINAPCINQKIINDSKKFHEFVKKEFPEIDKLKKGYFRIAGY